MSDKPPFLALDEGELARLMDAARLLEQTGERWLRVAHFASGDTSTPSPRPARTPAPRASKTQISNMVAEYIRTDPNPTMDGAWQFAQSKGVTGHQAAVRDEYRRQFGHPRVGRRRKNP